MKDNNKRRKDVEKLEPLYIVSGFLNGAATLENSLIFPRKVKLPYDSTLASLPLGV